MQPYILSKDCFDRQKFPRLLEPQKSYSKRQKLLMKLQEFHDGDRAKYFPRLVNKYVIKKWLSCLKPSVNSHTL